VVIALTPKTRRQRGGDDRISFRESAKFAAARGDEKPSRFKAMVSSIRAVADSAEIFDIVNARFVWA